MFDDLKDKVSKWLLTEAAYPLLITDASGMIVLSNRAAQTLFAYPEEELKGLPLESLLPERHCSKHQRDDVDYVHDPLKRPMNNGRRVHAKRRDGSEFDAEISLNPLGDGGVLTIIQDLTERRRVEEILRERQARLERTEEIAHLGSWELDLASKRLTWSDEVYRIFGLRPQEFVVTYEAFLERVHPDDRAAVDDAYSASLRENRDTYEIEHRIVRRDNGEIRIVHEKCQHFRDDAGRIVRSVGMIHDITERKQAEAALKEAQRLAGLGNWKWDLRTGAHTWSEEIFHIYGRDPALPPAVYPEVRQYFTPSSWARLAAAVEKAMAEGTPYECDAEVVRPDGSHRWILARGTAARDAGGNVIYLHGTVQDITERKRSEMALQAMRDDLEQLGRFQVASQTVAAIAHELNQPLNAVASYAETALRLLRAGNPHPDKLAHALEGSTQQAQRAGRVLGELFAFMKRDEVETELLDINDVVRSVLARIDTDGYGGFQTQLELDPGLPRVSANRLQVEKVMDNLIRNGVEAMRDAGVNVRSISIAVRTNADAGMAQVTVRDSGPGIDVHTLHRIFDPFFTTKPKGLGMGLAISRAIIESHGGQLWVESKPGAGASFHFTLPFAS